ncbi:MAG TPA: nitroreductase family protein [Anaeromyxobacter sp.]
MSSAAAAARTSEHGIDPMFFQRWSPRAFTGEEIPEATLLSFLEAARWAPSAMNAQPWRFAFARRGSAAFDRFLGVLAPANQVWAARASALVAIASVTSVHLPDRADPVPVESHSFDAGAAWAQLALQAHLAGWSTHAMGGFDRARANEVLALPPDHYLEVFVAVGRRGDPSLLPEWARLREKPSGRRPLADLVREGSFGA